MVSRERQVVLCDDDRAHAAALGGELVARGWRVALVERYTEAFALCCAHDVDALLVAPFLRSGSALVLPSALGIRKPPLTVLMTRLTERIGWNIAVRCGYDRQLCKAVDARVIDAMFAPVELERASTSAGGDQPPRLLLPDTGFGG